GRTSAKRTYLILAPTAQTAARFPKFLRVVCSLARQVGPAWISRDPSRSPLCQVDGATPGTETLRRRGGSPMLADVLDAERRQVVDELERRARLQAPPRVGRRAQLNALVDDLVGTLKRGERDDQPTTAAMRVDGSTEQRDRELVCSYVVDEAERHE